MQIKRSTILLIIISLLPILAFATTGDKTFLPVYKQVRTYLTGSLGLLFVVLGFVGAAAAIAGFASMKVMFPVFGLALLLRYGTKILEAVFTAPNDTLTFATNKNCLDVLDLACLMVAIAIFAMGYIRHRNAKQANSDLSRSL
jgi:hypothetical protein